jgi:immune inhibitor A
MLPPRPVPPAPHVLTDLYMDYVRNGKPVGLTFRQFLRAIKFTDPAANLDGMDDGTALRPRDGRAELISVPQRSIQGPLRVIVLLVDFSDRPGVRSVADFQDLLFSEGIFPSGSMRDYYREVSCGKVEVSGTVHGWLRMPQRYSYYTNNESGMNPASFPRNAQRLAEHAVRKALAAGVPFPRELDAFGDRAVTALFIVHAGPGAETFRPPLGKGAIWSHKWNLRTPVPVGPDLYAATYLTVPEDCRMGVCAHELGHLAFQWEDFYDPNGGDDGVQWAGTGRWDLMAGGSWNGDLGNRPAHPIGLHKSQHGWVGVDTVTGTTAGVRLPPYSATGGKVVKVVGPQFKAGQFLILENRQRLGFDDRLPGEGLLVWRVNLAYDQNAPNRPACQLIQADGRQDLENTANLNQGDAGDPFPGSERVTKLGDGKGVVSTTFPGEPRSGVTLSRIRVNAQRTITLDIRIQPGPAAGRAAGPGGAVVLAEAGVAPAKPTHPYQAGLDNLLRQPSITAAEMAPLVRAVTPTLAEIERQVTDIEAQTGEVAPPAAPAPAGMEAAGPEQFGGWLWQQYLRWFQPAWVQLGEFTGRYSVRPIGRRDYDYTPDATPFTFKRQNGQVITPGRMVTDGGSVPRIAWLVPDIDPWAYMDAYVLHDWLHLTHHCIRPLDPRNTFEEANLVLAEAIYTLMVTRPDQYPADWRKIVVIHTAVSSFVGRGLWDKQWDAHECRNLLPGFGGGDE